MKHYCAVLGLLFFTFNVAISQDRLNPPFPRIASYSLGQSFWPNSSIGSRMEILSKYDMAYIYGDVDNNGTIKAQKLRELNPNQILMAMGLNGLYFSDPPPYYLYRTYRGYLTQDIVPGQRYIPVSTTEGINQGLTDFRFCYVVINNDVIDVQATNGDSIVAIEDPNNAYAVNSQHFIGDSVMSVIRLSGPGVYPNLSEWSPAVDGKYVWDYLAEKNLIAKIEWNSELFDGLFHDAFYSESDLRNYYPDMNLNGVSDPDEFGSTPHAAIVYVINPHRRIYMQKWIQKELELMNQITPNGGNMLAVNDGGELPYFREEMNGHLFEGFLRWSSWNTLKDDCIEWMRENNIRNRPSNMFIEDYIPEKWAHNGKDRFTKMRYGLTTALLFDAYYGMTFGDWYYIMIWYDEFETDLGYGIGEPFELANGLWARYFDKGVAVCNPTAEMQTLSPSDLNGTFYRFKGGQDPVVNDGKIFDQPITIYGHTYSSSDKRGDGIIMFREPTTVVSDIIVDNFFHNSTSPGSNPVELEGGWSRFISAGSLVWDENNPYWSQFGNKQVIGDFDDAYGYHAIPAGDGSSTATWRPTIGVEGYYEIAEWHGWHGDNQSSYSEASNIPFEIVVNGGTKIRGIVDQTKNYGQWNVLGYGYLEAGTNSYVKITNNANGYVIADAVKFRYLNEEMVPDSIAPNPPKNLRIIN